MMRHILIVSWVVLSSAMFSSGGAAYGGSGALVVTPEALNFDVLEGGDEPTTQTLTIQNGSGGVVDFSVTAEGDWLRVAPSAGSSTGEAVEITVKADPNRLGIGVYEGRITIESPHAENSPVIIPVTLSLEPLKYSGGNGTAGDPYLIGDVADWLKLVKNTADYGEHFLLTADMDFAGVALNPIAPIWRANLRVCSMAAGMLCGMCAFTGGRATMWGFSGSTVVKYAISEWKTWTSAVTRL